MKTSKEKKKSDSGWIDVLSYGVKRLGIAIGMTIKNIMLLPVRLLMLLLNKLGNLFRFSLTFKISLIYTMLVLVVLIGFSIGLIKVFELFLVTSESELINQSRIKVQEAVSLVLENEDSTEATISDFINDQAQQEGVMIIVMDADTSFMYASEDAIKPYKKFDFKDPQIIKYLGQRYLVANARVKVKDGFVYLQIFKDMTLIDDSLRSLIMIAIFLTIILILTIIAIGSRISKTLLSPITTMTSQVKDVSIKSLDRRLDVSDAKDELKDLAMQFNSMLDHIEDAYSKQNQFVSDASHELRTPISVINGYVSMLDRWGKKDEAILDEAIQAIKGETIQMKELIEKLLFLARSDRSKIEMEIEKVDLGDLVEEICKETRMIDTKHDIVCEVEGQSVIYGNNKLIKQMMRIFIENAIKFTEETGSITLQMKAYGDRTMVAVKDSGIGIPKEDLEKIFDRFYRADKSRTKKSGGSGLGLSIAKWIIDQHGAEVRVFSEVGIGTKVEIWFNERVSLVDHADLLALNDDEGNHA